jgi:uncharacterized protein
VDKSGGPTFQKVMKGRDVLLNHGVEFNVLTCIQRNNVNYPMEIYRFLKESGTRFFQFIPIVERAPSLTDTDSSALKHPDVKQETGVTEWSVLSKQFGDFLTAVFDEWVRNDVGEFYIQIFDIALEAWYGMNPSLCVFGETCGKALAIEHNGDLYSCDHFVDKEFFLGNLTDRPLSTWVDSDQQFRFGQDKKDRLPGKCKKCGVRFICNGDCPKHRFVRVDGEEYGISYLCESYLQFFRHIGPAMEFMAGELRNQRPPSNVMKWQRLKDYKKQGNQNP